MSTPITDEATLTKGTIDGPFTAVPVETARFLEQQLNEVRVELENTRQELAILRLFDSDKDEAGCEIAKLQTELARVTAERDEAVADYERLTGILNARFPQRDNGSLPDWKIEDVLVENSALRRDKERLDWLEDKERCYYAYVQAQPDARYIWLGSGAGLREAIDVAMAKEGGAK